MRINNHIGNNPKSIKCVACKLSSAPTSMEPASDVNVTWLAVTPAFAR
jgi:hypothetical protein